MPAIWGAASENQVAITSHRSAFVAVAHLYPVERFTSRRAVSSVTVEEQDALEPVADQALQDFLQHCRIGGIVHADRARKAQVVVRCADPEHGQKERRVAQRGLGPAGDLGQVHRIGQQGQVMAVLLQ